jgi:hypothetical protein
MKRSLGTIALLFVAAFAPTISADTFSVTLLDGSGPTIDGTGSFTYSGGVFSNFTLTWDSLVFDMTSSANGVGPEAHGCDGGGILSVITYLTSADCQTGGSAPPAWEGSVVAGSAFLAFTPTVSGFGIFAPFSPGTPNLFQSGNFEVKDISQTSPTPEPNSVFVITTALLAVALVTRRRNIRGLKSQSTRTNS